MARGASRWTHSPAARSGSRLVGSRWISGACAKNGFGDLADGSDDVLAIVEHDQLRARPQVRQDLLQRLVLIERRQPEHRGEMRSEQSGVRQRREVDELHPVGVSVCNAQRDGESHGSLADAAGAGNRHQTTARKPIGDLGDNLVATEDARKSGGKPCMVEGTDGRSRPVRFSILARGADNLRHKRVAASRHARDEPGPRPAIAQRLAHRRDVYPQITLLDQPVGPNQGEEFRLADHLAGAFNESDKNVEGTRTERHRFIVPGQYAARRPKLKLFERIAIADMIDRQIVVGRQWLFGGNHHAHLRPFGRMSLR